MDALASRTTTPCAKRLTRAARQLDALVWAGSGSTLAILKLERLRRFLDLAFVPLDDLRVEAQLNLASE